MLRDVLTVRLDCLVSVKSKFSMHLAADFDIITKTRRAQTSFQERTAVFYYINTSKLSTIMAKIRLSDFSVLSVKLSRVL